MPTTAAPAIAISSSCAALAGLTLAALAQAPSQAQRDAIKSQCRSDYMAHCSSVPPGGEATLAVVARAEANAADWELEFALGGTDAVSVGSLAGAMVGDHLPPPTQVGELFGFERLASSLLQTCGQSKP